MAFFGGLVGVVLALAWAALAMSASTITVTLNTLLLNRIRFREAASTRGVTP